MQVSAVVQGYSRAQRQVTLSSYILRTGALLLGAATLLTAHAASARMILQTVGEPNAAVIRPLLAQTVPSVVAPISNGIYLFGERPLPDQLQTAYMIFEAQAGQVVGAFFSPYSSFDCFRGNVENTKLSLAITETYSQEEYAYSLELEDTAIAGPGGNQFAIDGFHQIEDVSDNDLRMLSTCQSNYSQTI